MRHASLSTLLVVGLLSASAAPAGADVTLLTQDRSIYGKAYYHVTDANPHTVIVSDSAPGFGPWSSAKTAEFQYTYARAAVSQTSTITTSEISGSGLADTHASITPGPLGVTKAEGRSYFAARFSVALPTLIRFDASFPIAQFDDVDGSDYGLIELFSVTTNTAVASIRASRVGGVGGPLNLQITLPPGTYEVRAKADAAGAGSHSPSGDYKTDVGYDFSMRVLCPADYNGDGFVDGIDYDMFNNDFEAGDPRADFNGDGFVDGIDYDQFNNAFEGGC
jgi:hypothetical protein